MVCVYIYIYIYIYIAVYNISNKLYCLYLVKNYNELSSHQQQRRRAKIQDGVREYLRSLPASNGLEPVH